MKKIKLIIIIYFSKSLKEKNEKIELKIIVTLKDKDASFVIC